MPRLTPQRWITLRCVFEQCGFVRERESSSHYIMVRKGSPRPIVIPKYAEVQQRVISGLIRTAGITREQYFAFLADC